MTHALSVGGNKEIVAKVDAISERADDDLARLATAEGHELSKLEDSAAQRLADAQKLILAGDEELRPLAEGARERTVARGGVRARRFAAQREQLDADLREQDADLRVLRAWDREMVTDRGDAPSDDFADETDETPHQHIDTVEVEGALRSLAERNATLKEGLIRPAALPGQAEAARRRAKLRRAVPHAVRVAVGLGIFTLGAEVFSDTLDWPLIAVLPLVALLWLFETLAVEPHIEQKLTALRRAEAERVLQDLLRLELKALLLHGFGRLSAAHDQNPTIETTEAMRYLHRSEPTPAP